jgi:hypothetical protein
MKVTGYNMRVHVRVALEPGEYEEITQEQEAKKAAEQLALDYMEREDPDAHYELVESYYTNYDRIEVEFDVTHREET